MGKIIVIDGLDGSGKHTQSEILLETLTNEGYKCKLVAFPKYESITGNIVTEYLSGKFNLDDSFDSKMRISMLYSYDRMYNMYFNLDENNKSLMDYYNEDYIIICDRYVSSNYLFMTHMMGDFDFTKYIWRMEKLEYDCMGLPRPDMTIFLEIPPTKSLELVEKRGNKKDIHETEEVLNKAYYSMQRYKQYCYDKDYKDRVHFINCMKNEIEMYSIEDISEMIKNTLQI